MTIKNVGEILATVRYVNVSTVDEKGQPWSAPVWYVFDQELNIYWWSSVHSQHSKNISQNSAVYLTIFDSTLPEGDGLGVYMRAKADEVPMRDLEKAMRLFNASTAAFKLDHLNCTAAAPTRMYKATPEQIWMNDGETKNGFYQDFRTEIAL